MDCTFCKIIAGQLPAEIVYQDDRAIIFKDHWPKAPIHLLVCTKKHFPTFLETPPDEMDYLLKLCRALADNLKVANGFRLQINNGPESGMIVSHLHIHFLSWIGDPRFEKLELETD